MFKVRHISVYRDNKPILKGEIMKRIAAMVLALKAVLSASLRVTEVKAEATRI